MDKNQELEKIAQKIRKCTKCRLHITRKNAVPGEGPASAKTMFIGQAPGAQEDTLGMPFVGRAGKFLDFLLEKNKINRKGVFITSVVKCFPPANRKPKNDEIEECQHYLAEQVKLVNPRTIVLLGNVAKEFMEKHKNLSENRRVIATVHPSSGMRFPKRRKKVMEDFREI